MSHVLLYQVCQGLQTHVHKPIPMPSADMEALSCRGLNEVLSPLHKLYMAILLAVAAPCSPERCNNVLPAESYCVQYVA